jgi:hypothetical protein
MKRIAVLVRDRQSEALRMALGLILVDDTVDVYVLDKKLEDVEQDVQNLALMKEMGINLYTDQAGNNGLEYLSTDEIARRLTEYDHVLPY